MRAIIMSIALTSGSFQDGQPIPKPFTGDGGDRSPALKWADPPAATKSFALICDDPDAPRGTFTHWVLFNLPANARSLDEGAGQSPPAGAAHGKNSFGKTGYGGPAPPPGKPHRYFFKLYALDKPLDLKAGASKEQVETAMKGHILAEGQLMGTYGR